MYYRIKPDEANKIEMCTVNSPNDSDWSDYEICKTSELAQDKVLNLLMDEFFIKIRGYKRRKREGQNVKSRI